MNKDIFQGNWEEIKGKMKKTWGWLTNDDFDQLEGNHQEIYGKLQKHYGYGRDHAEKIVKEFRDNIKH